jgi:prophage regulatory protein
VAEGAWLNSDQVASSLASTKNDMRFLRFPEVRQRVGLSRSTVWRLTTTGRFPRPYHLSAKAVGWLEPEIDAWIRERAARIGAG